MTLPQRRRARALVYGTWVLVAGRVVEVPRPGSGRCGGNAARLPAGGQQGRQIDQADAARENRQHIAEVLDGVDAQEPAAPKDRVGDGGTLTARVGSGK